MKLSKRMLMNISLIENSGVAVGEITVADIGCDHGFVSIYLLEKGLAKRTIAMDVAKGPLSKAKEHIREKGLENFIDTRLSDGAKALKCFDDGSLEADVMLMAGMGGRLTLKLIEDSLEKCLKTKYIVIQPQSDLELVRKKVMELGFTIDNEEMVLDEGKYYTAIGLVPNMSENKFSEGDYKYGPILLKKSNNVLKEYLGYKRQEFEKIYESTRATSPLKAKKMKDEIKIIEDCMELLTSR